MAKKLVIPSYFTAIDKFSGPVNKMAHNAEAQFARLQRNFRNAGQAAFQVGRSAGTVGLAIAAPLGLAVKSAIEFEDKMADVAKTTGLEGGPLKQFGEDILKMSRTTRSSIDDLAAIAEIGGQLGIAKKDLLAFTKASDQFNIALGKDFSGGVEEAVSSVGKIKLLFEGTRGLNISDAITKAGSAINELGAIGAGTSANITDFTLRLGALPDAVKPSIQSTLALGTFLEELGIDSRIGSGGLTNFFLVAGQNIGGFAQQMKITQAEAKKLLAEDPTEFAKNFATTFKGVAPEVLAQKLLKLKIGSQETIKVIGALGSGTERLTELQKVSSKAFADGTSLQAEANKKNEVMAAKMAMLKNNVKALGITMGNALLPVITQVVEQVTPFIQGIANWISRNKELTGTILKVVAGAGALALVISGIAFTVGVYQKAVVLARMAQLAWNVAVSLNPIGLLVAGLAALVALLPSITSMFDSQTVSQKLHGEVMGRAMEKTVEQRVEMARLFETLRQADKASLTYKNTLDEINRISPGLVEKYDLQEKSLRKINLAEKELTKSILDRKKAEVRNELLGETLKEIERVKMEGPGMIDRAMNSIFGTGKSTFWSSHASELSDLDEKKKLLVKQIVQDEKKSAVSTKATQNETTINQNKTNTEKMIVDFQNVPMGTMISGGGKSQLFNAPKTTSTR